MATSNRISPRFLRLPDVKQLLSVSGSSIWAWIRQGKFPQPIKLSAKCTAWDASEVEAWAKSRIAASQKVEGNHDNSI